MLVSKNRWALLHNSKPAVFRGHVQLFFFSFLPEVFFLSFFLFFLLGISPPTPVYILTPDVIPSLLSLQYTASFFFFPQNNNAFYRNTLNLLGNMLNKFLTNTGIIERGLGRVFLSECEWVWKSSSQDRPGSDSQSVFYGWTKTKTVLGTNADFVSCNRYNGDSLFTMITCVEFNTPCKWPFKGIALCCMLGCFNNKQGRE